MIARRQRWVLPVPARPMTKRTLNAILPLLHEKVYGAAFNDVINVLAASSHALAASAPPWLQKMITPRCRVGASHATAYHIVLLPPCISAVPPAQGRCITSQPIA